MSKVHNVKLSSKHGLGNYAECPEAIVSIITKDVPHDRMWKDTEATKPAFPARTSANMRLRTFRWRIEAVFLLLISSFTPRHS